MAAGGTTLVYCVGFSLERDLSLWTDQRHSVGRIDMSTLSFIFILPTYLGTYIIYGLADEELVPLHFVLVWALLVSCGRFHVMYGTEVLFIA